MEEDAKKAASVIAYNYPESKWYKYSFDLVSEQKEKKGLFNKMKNLIINNKEDGKKS